MGEIKHEDLVELKPTVSQTPASRWCLQNCGNYQLQIFVSALENDGDFSDPQLPKTFDQDGCPGISMEHSGRMKDMQTDKNIPLELLCQ